MISEWHPLDLKPQIVSIAVVTIILVILSVIYFVKSKKLRADQAPTGYCLAVEVYVSFFKNMVNEILGPKMEKITPLFLYLFSYIFLSNIIGVFGLENPTSCYTVTLSLALITYFGVWTVGFKYQKASYLRNFCLCLTTKKGKKIPLMINPLEVMSNIAPLISLSFRLWGNILAGSIITTLWYFFTNFVWHNVPVLGQINILGGLTGAPIRAYFDLVSGLIQAYIFVMLSMMYWKLAQGDAEAPAVKPLANANLNIASK